jgi:hypothetical protein
MSEITSYRIMALHLVTGWARAASRGERRAQARCAMRGFRERVRSFTGEKEDTMASHEFMIKLNQSITAEEADALYEAGCSDAAVETGSLGTLLDFSREAPTLADALLSAIRDIDKVPGLSAVGVQCDTSCRLPT